MKKIEDTSNPLIKKLPEFYEIYLDNYNKTKDKSTEVIKTPIAGVDFKAPIAGVDSKKAIAGVDSKKAMVHDVYAGGKSKKIQKGGVLFNKTKVRKLMSDRTPFHKTKVGKLMSDSTPFHKTEIYSQLFQKGGKLKLDELKEFEDDFKKLGYELENGKYVLKDTTKPALDKEITTLIEANLFKPHKIESDDFIKDGNLLDCFKSGVRIDDKLAQKLFENKYKGSVKNKYEGTFEGSKITHPTHFIVRDTEDDYYLVRFLRYHTMGGFGISNPPQQQSTWSYIASLEYRPFTHNLTDLKSTGNLSLYKNNIGLRVIDAIEYFDVYMGIRAQNTAIDNIEEAVALIPDENKFMKELFGNKEALRKVVGNKDIASHIVSYIGRGKKSKKARKSRKNRKARKSKKNRKS